jgi:hypothetical protein
MTDVKVTGQGTPREAAQLGQMIGKGVTAAAAGMDQSLHIDTLHLTLPAGASQSEINGAVLHALARIGRRP